MTKTFKAFAGKNWVALTSREAFKEADKAGKPIRIEFDNGSRESSRTLTSCQKASRLALAKQKEVVEPEVVEAAPAVATATKLSQWPSH